LSPGNRLDALMRCGYSFRARLRERHAPQVFAWNAVRRQRCDSFGAKLIGNWSYLCML
jgi:hypothetical protein